MADPTTTVAIASATDDDGPSLLPRVLGESDFWTTLARSNQLSGKDRSDYRILIMPDVDCLGRDISSHTDPRLVEHLVDLLHEGGWPLVAVGVASDAIFRPFRNRDAFALADAAGYQFVTDRGSTYDVEDLAGRWASPEADPRPGPGSPLISAPWLEADFRICFPKIRSDPDSGYRLALAGLAGLVHVPFGSSSMGETRPEDRIRYLLDAARPGFVILDGWTCCLGPDGTFRPVLSTERALIAGADPVIVDWVAAGKMGVAASSSPVFRAATASAFPSQSIHIVGNVAPFEGMAARDSSWFAGRDHADRRRRLHGAGPPAGLGDRPRHIPGRRHHPRRRRASPGADAVRSPWCRAGDVLTRPRARPRSARFPARSGRRPVSDNPEAFLR